MIEYHGWITLCCADKKWADNDWDSARQTVAGEVARFSVADGHLISFAETTNSMQTVMLSGHTDEDITGVLRFMEFVGGVVRDSYGELLVLSDAQTDLSTAARYRLTGGRVLRYDTNDV
jgi:hypothetical protein